MTTSISGRFDHERRSSAAGQNDWGAARRYVLGVLAVVATCIGGFAVLLALLAKLDMLPPPPLTGTACMDEKFKFLAERDLRDVDLIAVGSSVTWRNLDMTAFRQSGVARQPFNAAPCYLHVSEVVAYTGFLLAHMPRVTTVVSVLAPRDFERCTSPRDAFFSSTLAEAYIFDGLPAFPIYLANLAPHKFVRDIFRIRQMRSTTLVMDEHGAGPLHAANEWLPKPAFDDMCFAALSELERTVTAHGARLVVATLPLQPKWRDMYDPDGQLVATFERRARGAFVHPSTLFHAGSQAASPSYSYADAVHFLWDSTVRYSANVADLAAQGSDQ
jgi:hypothetical protein